jgi:hypothetical protein
VWVSYPKSQRTYFANICVPNSCRFPVPTTGPNFQLNSACTAYFVNCLPSAIAATWGWKNQFTKGEAIQICGCPRCIVSLHILYTTAFSFPFCFLSLSLQFISLFPPFLHPLYLIFFLSFFFLYLFFFLLLTLSIPFRILSVHYCSYCLHIRMSVTFHLSWYKSSFSHSSFDSQCM